MPFDILGMNIKNSCDWYFDGLTFIPLLLWRWFFKYTQAQVM